MVMLNKPTVSDILARRAQFQQSLSLPLQHGDKVHTLTGFPNKLLKHKTRINGGQGRPGASFQLLLTGAVTGDQAAPLA